MREWIANKNYADPFTLAKSARELEGTVAGLRSQVQLKAYPADQIAQDGRVTPANPDARKAWDAAMGVPASAEKYEIPATTHDDPTLTGYLKDAMLKAGVPATMAPALKRGYDEAVTRMLTEIRAQENTQSELAMAELKNAWGANYAERLALGGRGKEWLSSQVGGLTEQQLRGLESVLGTPKFMETMWKLGAANGEGRFAGGNNASAFASTASQAQARLDQLTADRAGGKISDFEWRSPKIQDEINQLRDTIVAGMAPAQP